MDVRVLIMDEPTSSLTQSETERLYTVIDGLKAAECVRALHFAPAGGSEALRGPRGRVARRAQRRRTRRRSASRHDAMVRLMVGRDLRQFYPKVHRTGTGGEKVLSVRNLRYRGGPDLPASFDVRAGEILGMAGLVGRGPHRTVGSRLRRPTDRRWGIAPQRRGALRLPRPRMRSPRGCLLVPEDRRLHGLVVPESVGFNLSLPNLGRLGSRLGLPTPR